jgi:2-dehydro-3-deoxyphosphogluconate aldolase/(4S)-4-hydroxy-2-oxoglutarate aldolase
MTEQLRDHGLIPVITLTKPEQAVGLGNALLAGGLPVAEVTLRSDAGMDGIRLMAKECPGMLVGAGTVLSVDQAKAALDAGAAFVVTPGFNHDVVALCVEKGVPVYPGVSGTEGIEAARAAGLRTVKFFPAEQAGGVPMLKALAAPYQEISFIPTGGVSPANVSSYLALPSVVACGGSWLTPKNLIAAGEFDKITAEVRRSIRAIYGIVVGPDGVEIVVPNLTRTRRYLSRSGIDVADAGDSIRLEPTRITLA